MKIYKTGQWTTFYNKLIKKTSAISSKDDSAEDTVALSFLFVSIYVYFIFVSWKYITEINILCLWLG